MPEESPVAKQSPAKKRYKAVSGDNVDELISKILLELDLAIPFVRIQKGKYLIGTEVKTLMITNNHVMVRIGGGFDPLPRYLEKNEDEDITKLKRMMDKEGKAVDEVIVDLLGKANAEAVVIKSFNKALAAAVFDKAMNKDI